MGFFSPVAATFNRFVDCKDNKKRGKKKGVLYLNERFPLHIVYVLLKIIYIVYSAAYKQQFGDV